MRDRIENAQVMLVALSAPSLARDWRSPIRPIIVTVPATCTVGEQLAAKAEQRRNVIQ